MRWAVTIAFLLLSATGAAAAEARPSFDCTKASSAAEKAICSDAELMSLDQELSRSYEGARRAGKVSRSSQSAWLRNRDTSCRPSEMDECLRDLMRSRIAELQSALDFAYGTATCLPAEGVAKIAFDVPGVSDRESDFNPVAANHLFSWRCDLGPERSITVKYRFKEDRPCGIASIWENGVNIRRQAPIGHCASYVLQSATISASGLEACYLSPDPQPKQRCDTYRRKDFPPGKDPYFTAGRLPGQGEPRLIDQPMRRLEGQGNPRCEKLAKRLSANWEDDMSDLTLNVPWRDVSFPNSKFPVPTAVASFDIDNDGQPEVVLRQTWESHMVAGDRYSVFPRDSWIGELQTVENEKEFYEALNKATSKDQGTGYELDNPFGPGDEHYTMKALSIAGRTVIFARSYAEPWMVKNGEIAWRATRIFFEVRKTGEIAPICSFAPPLHLGEQL